MGRTGVLVKALTCAAALSSSSSVWNGRARTFPAPLQIRNAQMHRPPGRLRECCRSKQQPRARCPRCAAPASGLAHLDPNRCGHATLRGRDRRHRDLLRGGRVGVSLPPVCTGQGRGLRPICTEGGRDTEVSGGAQDGYRGRHARVNPSQGVSARLRATKTVVRPHHVFAFVTRVSA